MPNPLPRALEMRRFMTVTASVNTLGIILGVHDMNELQTWAKKWADWLIVGGAVAVGFVLGVLVG